MTWNMQKNGKDYFLRVYIDKEEGIDLNDCEKVSNDIKKRWTFRTKYIKRSRNKIV